MIKRPLVSFVESGEPWIGMMPYYWEKIRIKFCLTPRPKVSDPTLPAGAISFGRVIQKSDEKITAETKATYRIVKKGDFLINPINLNYDLKSLRTALSAIEVCVSSAYLVARPARAEDSRHFLKYLLYVFDILHMKTLGAGVRQTITLTDIGNCFWCLPDTQEQKQIAAYLNRETAKIDKLIAKQQKLIKLLQEKRQAVISQVVTKGLDPSVKMKNSGVEWLGEVPEHWTQLSIRHMTQILRGKFTHRPRNDPAFYDGDFPFIQTGDITKADKYITSYKQTLNEKGAAVSRQFPSGTLVMAIAANIGDVGIINFNAYFPDSIVGLIPRDRTNLDYLYFLMQALKPSLIQNATVSTQMNLNADQIARITVVCPPLHEQIKVVEFIETRLSLFHRLSEKAQNALNLLKEHRQALITAAVTGKIDVRGLVTDEEVAALDTEPEVETTEEDFSSEVLEDTYITEEE